MSNRAKYLTLLLSTCLSVLPSVTMAEKTTKKNLKEDELEAVDVVDVGIESDAKGYDDIYDKNVSGDYKGRKEINQYRIDSAGDVLKGLNNVYNMNSRTAGGAITPNIRGIAGKGRIPVTIDGTEQTIDVWLNNYGVGDRNYVDPSLFRSITVEKGPSLTRGVKSGVGGSIAIRTIEPIDIIPEGKNWGIEAKADFSDNTIKPKADLGDYLGWPDYRTLPGGATADGSGGGIAVGSGGVSWSPFALLLDDFPAPQSEQSAFKFGDDNAYHIAAAYDGGFTNALAAYSYRTKGNYFAGKKGADEYMNNPIYAQAGCWLNGKKDPFACNSAATFVPNMAKIYAPGEEVFNSSTETETILLKNNWNLPKDQKIGLQYMRNNITFGEINPFQMTWELRYNELNPQIEGKPSQIQGIKSDIHTDTYKFSYDWQPEGNKFIDLKSNLYYVKTKSKRFQSGGMTLATNLQDPIYDVWRWANARGDRTPPNYVLTSPYYPYLKGLTEEQLYALPFYGPNGPYRRPGEAMPDYCKNLKLQPGQPTPLKCVSYGVVSGALQETTATRVGGDVSNHMQLNDNLGITIGADFQYEKLDEESKIANGQDMLNIYGTITQLTKLAGPRSGQRHIFGVNSNVDWQITDKLNLQAGLRYERFSALDTATGQLRADRNVLASFGAGSDEYLAGITVPVWELIDNPQMIADFKQLAAIDSFNEQVRYHNKLEQLYKKYNITVKEKALQQYYNPVPGAYINSLMNTRNSKGLRCNLNSDADCGLYRVNFQYTPIHGDKIDSSKITIGGDMLKEKVSNPGNSSSPDLYRYLAGKHLLRSNIHVSAEEYYDTFVQEGKFPSGTPGEKFNITDNLNATVAGSVDIDSYAEKIYEDRKPITEAMRWQAPQKISGHAWAPTLALTYDVTENNRLFIRYAQKTRFPSIYEATATDSSMLSIPTLPPELKPERSTNWEIGYAYNFAPYWKKLYQGDVRLTYYNNQIKNALDTTEAKRITQYDKKKTSGLELQARMDSGKYFAALGATYRLKQEVCDKDMAISYDLYLHRVPECIEGGFGATRFYQALQPKYSINADIGTRLLDNKLELGVRGIYHSGVKTDQYDDMVKKGISRVFFATGRPYHWKPSLVFDLYGNYRMDKHFNINFGVTNVTDRYYLDPMSTVPTPGPGRTFTLGFEGRF